MFFPYLHPSSQASKVGTGIKCIKPIENAAVKWNWNLYLKVMVKVILSAIIGQIQLDGSVFPHSSLEKSISY